MAWDIGNAWQPDWHGRWRSHKPGQALVEQNVARPLLRVRNTGTTERLQAMYGDDAQALADYNAPLKKWDDYPEMPPQDYLDAQTRLAVADYMLSRAR